MASKSVSAGVTARQRTISPSDIVFIADMLHVAAGALRDVRTTDNRVVQAFENTAQRAEALADALERV